MELLAIWEPFLLHQQVYATTVKTQQTQGATFNLAHKAKLQNKTFIECLGLVSPGQRSGSEHGVFTCMLARLLR